MRDDPSVAALVARVGEGDQAAWNELVERYSPLVWSICLHYQLNRQDIDDVGQNVWLRLVRAHRQPPRGGGAAGLAGDDDQARGPADAVLRASRRRHHADLLPDDQLPGPADATIEQEHIAAERNAALRAAFAELAQLTYDSSRDAECQLSLRAEAASIRALTFTSAHLTIELEVTRDSLLGQIIPAQAGVIKIQPMDGAEAEFPADEIGCFSVCPLPAVPFRLHCRTVAGLDVLTGWITL
jgi:hypothetical protein